MFSSLKRKLAAVGIAIAGLLGYQVARPPVLSTNKPPVTVATPTPVPTATPIASPTPQGITGTVSVHTVRYATGDEPKMIARAVEIDNIVVRSQCFEDQTMKAHFTETNNLTNAQILSKMREKASIGVEMFYGSWSQNHIAKTMGFDIGDGFVYANRYFISSAIDMASLIIHEVAHEKQFSHYGTMSTSVPYTYNDIVESCAKELRLE